MVLTLILVCTQEELFNYQLRKTRRCHLLNDKSDGDEVI